MISFDNHEFMLASCIGLGLVIVLMANIYMCRWVLRASFSEPGFISFVRFRCWLFHIKRVYLPDSFLEEYFES